MNQLQYIYVAVKAMIALLIVCNVSMPLYGQLSQKDDVSYHQIYSIVQNAISSDYKDVYVFDCNYQLDALNQIDILNWLLQPPPPAETPEAQECNNKDEIAAYIIGELGDDEVKEYLRQPECKDFEMYYRDYVDWESKQFTQFYIVTKRFKNAKDVEIIGVTGKTDGSKEYVVLNDILSNKIYKNLINSNGMKVSDYLATIIQKKKVVNITLRLQKEGQRHIAPIKKAKGK